MSYSVIEISQEQGSPVECYTFQNGPQYWRYTSSFSPQTISGQSYTPYPIKRGNVTQSADTNKIRLSIESVRDLPLVISYLQFPFDGPLLVTLQRFHTTDGGTPEVVTFWQGRVISISVNDNTTSRIECELAFSQLQNPGQRRRYQPGCPWALYKQGCRLSEATVQLAGTLLSYAGTTLTSATFSTKPDNFNNTGIGWWVGGKFITSVGLATYWRTVLNHTSDTIVIDEEIPGMAQNASFLVSPGCDRTMIACNYKFGNIKNYGGFPYKPTQNPFSSNPY